MSFRRLTASHCVFAILTCPPLVSWSAAAVHVDGSSTVFPIAVQVATELRETQQDAPVIDIGISGTSGGFRKFCRGATEISNASRPITREEMDECERHRVRYVELPVAFDAITVVVNARNDFIRHITVEQLKRLWEPGAEQRVMRWNQLDPAWPDSPIKLYGPAGDSGTFDYFTEVIVGRARASRQDYAKSEDDKVLVQGVARELNALGYFGYAYYVENRTRLRALSVADKGRPPVEPSLESVILGRYVPLSRPVFVYVNAAALERPEVLRFVEFWLLNGVRAAKLAKYIPLSDNMYSAALDRLRHRRTGTKFGGAISSSMPLDKRLE